MRKLPISLLVICAAGLLSSSALAQEKPLGKKGTLVLSAERLVSVLHYEYNETRTSSGTLMNVLWGSSVPRGMLAAYPSAIPRFAVDSFVSDKVSLGIAGGASVDRVKDEKEAYFTLILAPRIGYSAPLNRQVDLWARGGFTWYTFAHDGATFWSTQLNVEALLVYRPSPKLPIGLTLGPVLGMGIVGKEDGGGENARSHDATFSDYGLTGGLVGYL